MLQASAIRVAFILCTLSCSSVVASSNIVLYDADTSSQSIVASAQSPLDLWRPRINDLGEIVWHQQLTVVPTTTEIFSSVRGQIASGTVSEPDINNQGEIIWRFGNGASGNPNGIESNVRGVILSSSSFQDPYYDTQRINNHGEVVATRVTGSAGVWTNQRGYLPTLGAIARESEISDSGEIVYQSYDNVAGVSHFKIHSTVGGTVSASDWVFAPDINNLGEIVWQQSIRPSGFPPQWEIWSNLRGKIGDGEQPSINDLGEVVWQFWDGNDYEVYSNVRGQITSNDGLDEFPHINNWGDIAWKQSGVTAVPEPSSGWLAVSSIAAILVRWKFAPTFRCGSIQYQQKKPRRSQRIEGA